MNERKRNFLYDFLSSFNGCQAREHEPRYRKDNPAAVPEAEPSNDVA